MSRHVYLLVCPACAARVWRAAHCADAGYCSDDGALLVRPVCAHAVGNQRGPRGCAKCGRCRRCGDTELPRAGAHYCWRQRRACEREAYARGCQEVGVEEDLGSEDFWDRGRDEH